MQCSISCGSGGTKRRQVTCGPPSDHRSTRLENFQAVCDEAEKPPQVKPCDEPEVPCLHHLNDKTNEVSWGDDDLLVADEAAAIGEQPFDPRDQRYFQKKPSTGWFVTTWDDSEVCIGFLKYVTIFELISYT